MTDVFQILPEATIKDLELKLRAVHACQGEEEDAQVALGDDPTNVGLIADLARIQASLASRTQILQGTTINTTNLIKSFKDLDETTIKLSNSYYAKYGSSWSVENLSWSSDYILNTCDDSLRDKAREGLVMNVDDATLCSLTEGL